MRSASLVSRLAVVQMALAGALLLALSASAILISAHALERQEGAYLMRTATDLGAALADEWGESSDLGRAAEVVLQEDAPTGLQVEILDEQMRVVRSTVQHATRRAGHPMRSARAHVSRGAWVVVSVSTRPRRQAIETLSVVLLLVGVPLFAVGTVLSRILAQRMLRPLRRMAAESTRASESGIIVPLGRPEDPAELRELAAAFNQLLSRLDDMLRSERLFAQDAAHELRTPLTIISGEIELALSKLGSGDARRSGLERAAEQARTMGELVEALLFLKQSAPVTPEPKPQFVPVNLSDLVRDAVAELLARVPGRAGDLTLAVDDEALVAGHSTLLASALRNLLGNALKFTTRGQAIRIGVRVADGLGRVTVEDAGKGVRAEDRERIFDPFYRDAEARAGQEGFGLGLAILRRVARAHGGDVELGESSLGGARFDVRLPAWSPSPVSG